MVYEQLPDWQLQLGYWYARNRVMIRAVVLSVLFFCLGVLIFFNTKTLIGYSVGSEFEQLHRQILSEQIIPTVNRNAYAARPLVWSQVVAVTQADRQVLYTVTVQNPNQKVAVQSLRFAISAGSWQSNIREEYLLPGQTRRFVIAGPSGQGMQAAQVVVIETDWQRIRDVDLYTATGNFVSPDIAVSGVRAASVSSNVFEVQATLTNQSIYNYAQVSIVAVVYSGNTIVAIQERLIPSVVAGETRTLSLRWPYALPSVTRTEVLVSTNLIDSTNLVPFGL